MHARLLSIAQQTRTPLVDARQLLAGQSAAGITGNKVLLDHVHPTIEAHQWIAEALLEKMNQLIASAYEAQNNAKSEWAKHYWSVVLSYPLRQANRLN